METARTGGGRRIPSLTCTLYDIALTSNARSNTAVNRTPSQGPSPMLAGPARTKRKPCPFRAVLGPESFTGQRRHTAIERFGVTSEDFS